MPIKKLAALATLTITLGLGIFPAHAQKMYWTDSGTGKIQRSDLDGSNVEDLAPGLGSPQGIALDVTASRMYWTDIGTDTIQRASLDGSNVEVIVSTSPKSPRDIALDLLSGGM